MNHFARLLLLIAFLSWHAAALSGRAAFVFNSALKVAGLQALPCPGKLGNATTRCAVGSADHKVTQQKLSAWKGWRQTDRWAKDSAAFTSNGTDGYAVTVMPKIGTKTGSLLIFSEF